MTNKSTLTTTAEIKWWEFSLSLLPGETIDIESIGWLLMENGAAGVEFTSDHTIKVSIDSDYAQAARCYSWARSQCYLDCQDLREIVSTPDWSKNCRELLHPLEAATIKVIPVRSEAEATVWQAEHGAPSGGRHHLFVIPGMGFGTGHHESTHAALELLQSKEVKNVMPKRIFDLGTGSGILAIAAQLLYPDAEIIGNDIDEAALNNALENAAINSCAKIKFIPGSLPNPRLPDASFDLIFANIYAEALCALEGEIHKISKPGGLLILAGIFGDRDLLVEEKFKANWEFLSRIYRERQGDDTEYQRWTALLLRNKV
jgi:ribosomal protein L11 methyltransferase